MSDRTESAIAQAVSDGSACYAIGYFRPAEKLDGKYHKIRVAIDRPGLRAQTRQGYYADRSPISVDERMADILQTGSERLSDDPGIGMRASLVGHGVPGAATRLRIRVDTADLLLTAQGRRYLARLELTILGYTDEGPRDLVRAAPIDLELTEAERDIGLKEGLAFSRDLALDAKIRALRVIVVDRRSGATRSLTIPLSAGNANLIQPGDSVESSLRRRRS